MANSTEVKARVLKIIVGDDEDDIMKRKKAGLNRETKASEHQEKRRYTSSDRYI